MNETEVQPKTKKAFLTSGEVATLLGCTSSWVNVLISKGELKTHRIGGRGWHRISSLSLERYATEHEVKIDWNLLN